MTKYYFTFKIKGIWKTQYVIIIAESEELAKDVFQFCYQKHYDGIYKTEPQGLQFQLYETLTQRLTEN